MPPKRGQKPSTQTRSKKRKTNSGISESTPPVPMDADLQINTQPTSAIDYDKLALAILKHSAPANEIPATPALIACSNTPGPSSMSSPQDSLPTSTGLGELLDKVFTGEPARPTPLNHPTAIISDGFPLAASLSTKVKTKIWNNEYIDFRTIINSREEPLSVSISSGVINLHQNNKFKTPITMTQWTDAFLVFAAVFIEKFPAEAPHLLKYGHMVREIYHLHGDNAFRAYDEQFRKLRESVNVPWQHPIQELRLKAATATRAYPPKIPQTQTQPFRVRYCFQYNKGERCHKTPCPFRHSCMQCKGYHPKSRCTDNIKSHSQSATKPTNPSQNKKLA